MKNKTINDRFIARGTTHNLLTARTSTHLSRQPTCSVLSIMVVPKTLSQVASLTSSFISSFSSFTSEAQDERDYEEYLRGPTYEDVHPPKSREATPASQDREKSPWRSVGLQRQGTLEPVEEVDSDSEYVYLGDTI